MKQEYINEYAMSNDELKNGFISLLSTIDIIVNNQSMNTHEINNGLRDLMERYIKALYILFGEEIAIDVSEGNYKILNKWMQQKKDK